MTPPLGEPLPMRIEALAHQNLAVATQIHALQRIAHAQEAALLGVQQAVAMVRTAADLQHGEAMHLGAICGDVLAGVVSLAPDDEPGCIGIATLVVHPRHQRQGIARALLHDALRRGAGEVFVVCTGESNAPALALYRSLGFVPYRRGTMGAEELVIVKLRRAPTGLAPASC